MASLDSGSFIATGSSAGSFDGFVALIQRLLGTGSSGSTPITEDPLPL